MTPEQFAYWLQGCAELTPETPSAAQWQAIRDHLGLVFDKKTPTRVIGPARSADDTLSKQLERWQEGLTRPGYVLPPATLTC